MLKTEILNLVVARVESGVHVLELGFHHARARIAGLVSARMIGACVTALRHRSSQIGVLGHEESDEVGQGPVHMVGHDADTLGSAVGEGACGVADAIELQGCNDVTAGVAVCFVDGLGAEQAAFLGAVPVELDGVGKGAGEGGGGIVKEDSGCLEDGDGATAVVVGAWRAQDGWEEEVYTVLVGADDDGLVALAGDAEDDG